MDISRIDPVKLRHLVAIVDAGSFAGAAERMGISQPAISKSVRSLESALGLRLFERGRAGAQATPQGELLAQHGRAILAEYGLAAAELRALGKGEDQQLRIGASLSLAQSLLPPAIGAFRRRWPDQALSVEVGLSSPLLDGLSAGDVDLVLSAPEEGIAIDGRITQTYLLEERDALVVGAGHPLLRRENIALEDLLTFPWIIPQRSSRLDRIRSVFARHRLPPPAYVLRSESADLARGLLREEPFICLMGEGVLRADVTSGAVAILPELGFGAARAPFVFTRRSAHLRLAARNLFQVLVDTARAQA